MARYAPAALVAALLVATALAFAHTESLKLTPSPILGTRVAPKVFSPTCRCFTGRVNIGFRLRQADRLDVEIVVGKDTVVRSLARGRRFPRGAVIFTWDGLDDQGEVVPEGVYKPRVRLLTQRRTIVLPNPIRVDTTPPHVTLVGIGPRVFSPDGDRRRDRVIARYTVDEPSRVSLFVDGARAVRRRGAHTSGRIDWYGTVKGKTLPAGAYGIRLGARDVAGNVGPRTPARTIVIRYIALGRKQIHTVVGRRLAVLVLTDAGRYDWKLGARTGTARSGTLVLRSPQQAGRFTLSVSANGHAARAAVFVGARP